MRAQPKQDYKSNDAIMTPEVLTESLVKYFNPTGIVLEPCKGTGNFLKFLPVETLWCEITEGVDFLKFDKKVDWIFTNPPYSIFRKFLKHSMEVSKNVCFLITINHLWTRARVRDIEEAGFKIREILIVDTPKNFPPSGFQYGMVHLQKGYTGDIKFSKLI